MALVFPLVQDVAAGILKLCIRSENGDKDGKDVNESVTANISLQQIQPDPRG